VGMYDARKVWCSPDLAEGDFCEVRQYGVLREHECGPRREPEARARILSRCRWREVIGDDYERNGDGRS